MSYKIRVEFFFIPDIEVIDNKYNYFYSHILENLGYIQHTLYLHYQKSEPFKYSFTQYRLLCTYFTNV